MIKRIFNFLFGRKKIRFYWNAKPICSKYISFNTRHIIYEYPDGYREAIKVTMPFDKPFPIETNCFITNEEFEKILKNEKKTEESNR